MKKLISLVLAALMALSLFAACGKSDNGGTTDNNDNAEVTGTVSTDGSTSMEKVIMSLGEQGHHRRLQPHRLRLRHHRSQRRPLRYRPCIPCA